MDPNVVYSEMILALRRKDWAVAYEKGQLMLHWTRDRKAFYPIAFGHSKEEVDANIQIALSHYSDIES